MSMKYSERDDIVNQRTKSRETEDEMRKDGKKKQYLH